MAYCTADELAWALHRPRLGPEEAEPAERCIGAASAEIDAWIDWFEGFPAPDEWNEAEAALVNRVCLVRAVEWWKANEAAFGLVGFADIGALRAPRDGFDRHRYTLLPLKQRWGVA